MITFFIIVIYTVIILKILFELLMLGITYLIEEKKKEG
jgi:hypothetical protein